MSRYFFAIAAGVRTAPSPPMVLGTIIEPQNAVLAFTAPDQGKVTLAQQLGDPSRDHTYQITGFFKYLLVRKNRAIIRLIEPEDAGDLGQRAVEALTLRWC